MAAILDFQVAHRADLTSSPQRTFVPKLVLGFTMCTIGPIIGPTNCFTSLVKHVRQHHRDESAIQVELSMLSRMNDDLIKYPCTDKTFLVGIPAVCFNGVFPLVCILHIVILLFFNLENIII